MRNTHPLLFSARKLRGTAFALLPKPNQPTGALAVRDRVEEASLPLYEAQLLSAKLTCLISGLCLMLVSVVLIAFYVKLYLDGHAKQIGILKALGVSDWKIASGFRSELSR